MTAGQRCKHLFTPSRSQSYYLTSIKRANHNGVNYQQDINLQCESCCGKKQRCGLFQHFAFSRDTTKPGFRSYGEIALPSLANRSFAGVA
jgi:hypothetical protein